MRCCIVVILVVACIACSSKSNPKIEDAAPLDGASVTACSASSECASDRWCNPGSSVCEPRTTSVDFDRDLYPLVESVCIACHGADGIGASDAAGTGTRAIFEGGPAAVHAVLTAGSTSCADKPHRLCVDEPRASLAVQRLLPEYDGHATAFTFPEGYQASWLQSLMQWTAAGAQREGSGPVEPHICEPSKTPAEDGCVIDEAYGIFVAPTGNDATGQGTRMQPYASIPKALAEAVAANKRVYACGGVYPGNLVLDKTTDGATVFGGIRCSTWTYDAAHKAELRATTEGIAVRLVALHLGITFTDVRIAAIDSTTAGTSSIALFVHAAANVKLVRTDLVAGRGANGADGVTPSDKPAMWNDASDGAWDEGWGSRKGFYGDSGATPCSCNSGWYGGCAYNDVRCTYCSDGGAAGAAGYGWYEPTAGGPAAIGGASGRNGSDTEPCTNGSNGAAGGDAAAVENGGRGGELSIAGWAGAGGGSGLTGSPGGGGGGGGGYPMRAIGCFCNPMPDHDPTDEFGAVGGGSGGMGGCGGLGGAGGGAGGASIALASLGVPSAAPISIVGSSLRASSGGNGGAGSAGQVGGHGGHGGGGGIDDSWYGGYGEQGCFGGDGGRGGTGGPGGGGSGGASMAVAVYGTAPTTDGATLLHHASAGLGGLGGNNQLIAMGVDGVVGTTVDVRGNSQFPDVTPPTNGGIATATTTSCADVSIALAGSTDDRTASELVEHQLCWSEIAGACASNWETKATVVGAGTLSLAMQQTRGKTLYVTARAVDLDGNISAASAERALAIPALGPAQWATGAVSVATTSGFPYYRVTWPAVTKSCPDQQVTIRICQGSDCQSGSGTSTDVYGECMGGQTFTVKVSDGVSAEQQRTTGVTPRFETHYARVEPALQRCKTMDGCHTNQMSPSFSRNDDGRGMSSECATTDLIIGNTAASSDMWTVGATAKHLCGESHFRSLARNDADALRCWIDQGKP